MASKRDQLSEVDPQIMLADGFDDAIVGYIERCGQPTIACYDVSRCIQILQDDGATHEEAVEHFDFNVRGAWLGERTPAWLTTSE